ncbi:MAG: chromosome segregation protein SMC [Pseudomonadales bacterium]|nr:chromosome segregation protein SMC [Pseudomonadales bacterium]
MRLKSIKLAGFKSFVDPATVNLPHNLTAIVGPNGCGKSNVIDAVRWVMGESSAKHLRGESMTDVIFNGSSGRKPISQAFIELIFDNSDGSMPGELGKFAEICIKRSVNRESQSHYFLNGTRCRRKDITDIFLGTGLGPRSYAIIEQGTISRLIEAKPEDLRVFIEEAAGISKYKERRRETENRMRRTRENLDRLDDIREELERQLQHLHRQSQTAERYKNYKTDERLLKAQLQALHWRSLDVKIQTYSGTIRDLELKREERITAQVGVESALETHHAEWTQLNDHFNSAQNEFYTLGAEVARLEQTIQHQKQREHEVQRDLSEVDESLTHTVEQIETDQLQIEELNEQVLLSEPEWELLQAKQEESSERLVITEEAMQLWQSEWDQFNAQASESSQKAQVEQSRIVQLEQGVQRGLDRIKRFADERETLRDDGLDADVQLLNEQLSEAEMAFESKEDSLESIRSELDHQRQNNSQLSKDLDQLRSTLQRNKGRFASLEALQHAAMGDSSAQVTEWLQHQSLDNAPRFADQLDVQSGWETAVETVLGKSLQAVCIDQVMGLSDNIAALKGSLHFVSSEKPANALPGIELDTLYDKAPKLLDFVSSKHSGTQLLSGVYCVDSLEDAFNLKGQLSSLESIVTRDGLWMGSNWLRVKKQDNNDSGVLARKQQIEQLNEEIEALEEQEAALAEKLEIGREQLLEIEQQRENISQDINQGNRKVSELKAQLSAKEVRLEQFSMRRQRLDGDVRESQEQVQSDQEAVKASRLILQAALDIMAADNLRREELLESRDQRRAALDEMRQTARGHKDDAHRIALETQTLKSQLDSTVVAMERLKGQRQQLVQRKQSLLEGLGEGDNPIEVLQETLEELLEKRLLVEEKVGTARSKQESAEQNRQNLEKQRSEAEQQIQIFRGELEKQRIEMQGLEVRRSTALEQLKEQQHELETVLENLPEDATEQSWSEELEKMAARINRLGAINLAAIDEYEKESERKNYLDTQHADLIEALETLENAIRKIDKETRSRFKETFEKVNSGLQELFPKVFGGGHAYLELTGDDLLDTGVAIMARPPGKRNSTIHLLSGGEKALTAIALVFSIFRLNPAPFCMLDEVDAPLDDANVARFCRLVKEMSKNVQFIYISHNKVAMEMAHVLMGVTMQEPGVSRLVSVDVDEAAAMAAM